MGIFSNLFNRNDTDYDDSGCDWYCDFCGAHMNGQPGFTTTSGQWTCTECGSLNDVSENNIFETEEDHQDYLEMMEEDNYDEDDEESISVYEAAEIWASRGMDEDYMFGYTEEELRNAL